MNCEKRCKNYEPVDKPGERMIWDGVLYNSKKG